MDAAGFLTNEAWREEHLRAAEALASNCDGDSLWELAGLTFIDWHAVRPTITRVHEDTTETVSLPAVPRGPPQGPLVSTLELHSGSFNRRKT